MGKSVKKGEQFARQAQKRTSAQGLTKLAHTSKLGVTKQDERRWLVIDADWGGQVLLTVPAELIDQDLLRGEPMNQLVRELNQLLWSCNGDAGTGDYFVSNSLPCAHRELGYGLVSWRVVGYVGGGMGGGYLLEDELWLHYSLMARGLEFYESIRARLGMESLDDAELVEPSDKSLDEMAWAVMRDIITA